MVRSLAIKAQVIMMVNTFDGIEFIYCPPGSFLMGSGCRSSDKDERPALEVEITRGFWLSKYPVTNAQWYEIMRGFPIHTHIWEVINRISDPVSFTNMSCLDKEEIVSIAASYLAIQKSQKEGKLPKLSVLEPYEILPNTPVTYLSWYDAMACIFKLNETLGYEARDYFGRSSDANRFLKIWEKNPRSSFIDSFKKVEAAIEGELLMTLAENSEERLDLWPPGTYRLPTEAEWEYACRAGTSTPWYWGEGQSLVGEFAWYDENSGSNPREVGLKKPNSWGFYDMAGNVWEWVLDVYERDMYGGGFIGFSLEQVNEEVIGKTKMFGGPQMKTPGPEKDPVYFSKNKDYYFFNRRVRRGGCVRSPSRAMRSTNRRWKEPQFRTRYNGLRLLRTV